MKTFLPALAAVLTLAACDSPQPARDLTGQGYIQGAAEAESVAPAAPEADTSSVPEDRPSDYALLGQKLPAFSAQMADGGTFDSSAINRWTVIAVWGVWCGDSRTDGPYTAALDRAVAQDPDLDFISIHVPSAPGSEDRDKPFGEHGSLDAYFDAAGYTLPTVIDSDGSIRDALMINWTPTYLLVSPDGIIRSFRTDLSADKDQPVKTYIKDVAETRKEVRDLLASDPSDLE